MGNSKNKPEKCKNIVLDLTQNKIKVHYDTTEFKHYGLSSLDHLIRELSKYQHYNRLELFGFEFEKIPKINCILNNIVIENLMLDLVRITADALDQLANILGGMTRVTSLIIYMIPATFKDFNSDSWSVSFCNLVMCIYLLRQKNIVQNIDIGIQHLGFSPYILYGHLKSLSDYINIIPLNNSYRANIWRITNDANIPNDIIAYLS